MNFIGAKNYIIDRLQQELPPNLYFHCFEHSLDVLHSATRLNRLENMDETESALIETAAIYHDAGMIRTYLDHESASAQLAREILPDFEYSPSEIEQVASLIMVTTMPQYARTKQEKVLCDADLDVLGREDFFISSFQLQLEWKIYGVMDSTLSEWIRFEIDFLENHKYYTSSAFKLRNEQKVKNLKDFKDLLKI
jgi:predicted metal-dependent HD superfamily phosphohydrolase